MLYYFPNRPLLLPPNDPKVGRLSNDSEWDAEIKYNGDRLVLIYDGKNFKFFNRNKEEFKRYNAPDSLIKELYALELPANTYLDGELLNFRTKNTKNQIVFYDIYYLGNQKMRCSLEERRYALKTFFKGKKFKHLKLIKQRKRNFKKLFDKIVLENDQLIEGLVIKNIKGKIVWNAKKSPNVFWQIKIRKPSKNYKF